MVTPRSVIRKASIFWQSTLMFTVLCLQLLVGPASISVSKCIKLILPGYWKGLALLWMDLAEDRTKLCKITQWFPYVLLSKINEHRPIKTYERHWSTFIPHASRFGLPRGWKVHCYMEQTVPRAQLQRGITRRPGQQQDISMVSSSFWQFSYQLQIHLFLE